MFVYGFREQKFNSLKRHDLETFFCMYGINYHNGYKISFKSFKGFLLPGHLRKPKRKEKENSKNNSQLSNYKIIFSFIFRKLVEC